MCRKRHSRSVAAESCEAGSNRSSHII